MQKSQEDLILDYLRSGKSLTPITALNLFGCFRLGARCFDLRAKGHNIQSELIKGENGKHFARYWLSDEPLPDEHSAMVAESNLHAEEKLNYKAVGAQLEFAV